MKSSQHNLLWMSDVTVHACTIIAPYIGLQLNDVNSVLGEVTAHQIEAEKVVSYEDESEHSALEAKAAEESESCLIVFSMHNPM